VPELHGKRLKRFLKEGRVTVVTFTSAATFDNFREMMGEGVDELLRSVAIAVIGPVTAKAVEKAGLHTLREGQKVKYELVPDMRGRPSADNLVVVE